MIGNSDRLKAAIHKQLFTIFIAPSNSLSALRLCTQLLILKSFCGNSDGSWEEKRKDWGALVSANLPGGKSSGFAKTVLVITYGRVMREEGKKEEGKV